MVTGTPWPVPSRLTPIASTPARAGAILSPALDTPRVGECMSSPLLLHYLLQELQDAVPLPGQALSLLGALQPDLGSLGIQRSHPLLRRRQQG